MPGFASNFLLFCSFDYFDIAQHPAPFGAIQGKLSVEVYGMIVTMGRWISPLIVDY